MTELKRIIKAGFLNFYRSGLISVASVLIVTITLSFITASILLNAVLFSSLNQIKDKVDVTIYFNVNTPESKILSLKDSLENLAEVKKVTYVSSSEAEKIFRERHKNDYSTIAALDEIQVNPFGGHLNVKAKEVSQYESIANFIKGNNALVLGADSIIDKINYNQNKNIIDRLGNVIFGAQKLGFLATLILMIISVIITFSTIRLAIFISREEIGIMRLVGASKMLVRAPFIFEGIIYGSLATILTLLIFWPVTVYLGNNMTNFLGLNLYDYYFSNFFQISVIVLLSGVLLCMFSSFIAIRKYLNK